MRTVGLRYQNQSPSYFVRYPLSTRSGLAFASNPTTSRFSLPTLHSPLEIIPKDLL
jgi:hypothetical protein